MYYRVRVLPSYIDPFKATKWFGVANVKLEEGWFNGYEIDGKAAYSLWRFRRFDH